jgi:hypothetical protein
VLGKILLDLKTLEVMLMNDKYEYISENNENGSKIINYNRGFVPFPEHRNNICFNNNLI